MNNLVDLNFVNYSEHPTNKQYVVFRFSDAERGRYFEHLLIENKVGYEKDRSDDGRDLVLFAIARRDLSRAEHLNYLVYARHRQKFIPSYFFRIFVLLLSAGLLILAILGYLNS